MIKLASRRIFTLKPLSCVALERLKPGKFQLLTYTILQDFNHSLQQAGPGGTRIRDYKQDFYVFSSKNIGLAAEVTMNGGQILLSDISSALVRTGPGMVRLADLGIHRLRDLERWGMTLEGWYAWK